MEAKAGKAKNVKKNNEMFLKRVVTVITANRASAAAGTANQNFFEIYFSLFFKNKSATIMPEKNSKNLTMMLLYIAVKPPAKSK